MRCEREVKERVAGCGRVGRYGQVGLAVDLAEHELWRAPLASSERELRTPAG